MPLGQAVDPLVGADQLGVLEVLGPDAHDQVVASTTGELDEQAHRQARPATLVVAVSQWTSEHE
jgi:hypothetical protein